MLNILHFTLEHVKNGIPFSQCKRYRRIISDDAKFSESVSQLRDFFFLREIILLVLLIMHLIKSLHCHKINISSRQKIVVTKTLFRLWLNTIPLYLR